MAECVQIHHNGIYTVMKYGWRDYRIKWIDSEFPLNTHSSLTAIRLCNEFAKAYLLGYSHGAGPRKVGN